MPLPNLEIIHIYEYHKAKGQLDPLKSFKREVNPLVLSTCMRHLYLFNQEQKQTHSNDLSKLLTHLQMPQSYQNVSKYDYLQGEQAYSFLLYWAIGGLNSIKPFNDDRLLGQLRKIYSEYRDTNLRIKKVAFSENKELMDLLMLDAKRMHKALLDKKKEMPRGDLPSLFASACNNCAWARNNDYLGDISEADYAYFFDRKELEDYLLSKLTISEERLKSSLKAIELKKAQLKANTERKIFDHESAFSPKTQLILEKIGNNVEKTQQAKLRLSKSLNDLDSQRVDNFSSKATFFGRGLPRVSSAPKLCDTHETVVTSSPVRTGT